jgi:hypothetical protein
MHLKELLVFIPHNTGKPVLRPFFFSHAGKMIGQYLFKNLFLLLCLALYSEWPKVGTTKIRNPLSMGFFDS